VTAEQVRSNGYELIVNSTAIGMRDEDPFEHLPLEPERLGRGMVVVDLVYAGSESRLVREAASAGRVAWKASRSWFGRAPTRFASGREGSHRSTSCGAPRERPESLLLTFR
jgi:hypothetical protein